MSQWFVDLNTDLLIVEMLEDEELKEDIISAYKTRAILESGEVVA